MVSSFIITCSTRSFVVSSFVITFNKTDGEMPKEERQGRQTPMITIWSAQGKWAFRFSLMAMRRNLGCVLLCYCLARRNAAALAIRPPNRQRLLLRRSSSHGDDDSTTGTSKATVLHSRNIPKAETKVLDLLERYPTADGRGVKIAILGRYIVMLVVPRR